MACTAAATPARGADAELADDDDTACVYCLAMEVDRLVVLLADDVLRDVVCRLSHERYTPETLSLALNLPVGEIMRRVDTLRGWGLARVLAPEGGPTVVEAFPGNGARTLRRWATKYCGQGGTCSMAEADSHPGSMSGNDSLAALAREVLEACRAAKVKLVIAESSSGGLLAEVLTAIPGASTVVERGYVVYSDAAKTSLLGVPESLIVENGAVSEAVVRAMAVGALAKAVPYAQISVADTGVAGPGSDRPNKPAGRVHIAVAQNGKHVLHEQHDFGDIGRDAVRRAAVASALKLILKRLTNNSGHTDNASSVKKEHQAGH